MEKATVIFIRGDLRPQKNLDNIWIIMNGVGAYLRGDSRGSRR